MNPNYFSTQHRSTKQTCHCRGLSRNSVVTNIVYITRLDSEVNRAFIGFSQFLTSCFLLCRQVAFAPQYRWSVKRPAGMIVTMNSFFGAATKSRVEIARLTVVDRRLKSISSEMHSLARQFAFKVITPPPTSG